MIAENELRQRELSTAKRTLLERRLRGGTSNGSRDGIGPRPRNGLAPLSFAQERLLFVQHLAAESPLYNLSMAVRLEGQLDERVLETALNRIVARHESLRTRFVSAEGEPVQVVDCPTPVLVSRFQAAAGQGDIVRSMFAEESRRPFDLARDLLLRAGLARLGSAEHVLLLTTHHIAADGWSMGILFKEFTALYRALISGSEPELPALPIQYSDYAVWQRERLSARGAHDHIDWWKQQLAGAPDVLELPADYPRPAAQTFRGSCQGMTLPGSLVKELRTLSRREGATLFMTLMAAFEVLIHRYTGRRDFLIGSPVAGRDQIETERLIGLFVNTLVWRADFSDELTFRELLQDVREATLGALAHSQAPFERLVEVLRPERSPNRAPLIQVMFALQNPAAETVHVPGLRITPIAEADVDTGTSKVDLTFQLAESGEGLRVVAEYSSDLFEAATISRWLGHFRTVLESAVSDADESTRTIPMLTAGEHHRVLVEWNDTQLGYPRDCSVPRLFEEQAAARPQAVAVTFEGADLTYRELDERANQLAHLLQSHGVGSGSPVALCMERSLEMIVGLLGILKAGAAYVSLDPSYPDERRAHMLSETGALVLLTQASLGAQFAMGQCTVVCLDRVRERLARESRNPPATAALVPSATDLAYVSFTSGSSGRPKGACISHRAVARLVTQHNYGALGPDDRFLQLAPVAFDASTFEIWGALLNGARLIVCPPGTPSLAELGAFIRANRITVLWLAAGLFHQMVEEQLDSLRGVRRVLTGGDVLSMPHVRRALEVLEEGCLINGYGPTENTTFTCCHSIRTADLARRSIPIGRPIANTQVYVLDEQLQPVPIGVPGELCVGGDGLARGYVNQPLLTADKFVDNPFSSEPGARMYRTGDRVRWQSDGTLEFLGRNDRQVKIRGFRVELEEVETILRRHPAVRQCAVVARPDSVGDKRLIAYVAGDPPAEVGGLRDYLRRTLPEYMVPACFVPLAALPLNANGKVHSDALPPAEPPAEPNPRFIAPRNEIERKLAGIWEELLGARPVGAFDNFFDLGGHSLLAIRLLARIEKTFGKALPVATVLASPTLEGLARCLETGARAGSGSSIVEIQSTGSKPPLFLVHGAGGGMLWGYANLARCLGPDQPVYGFKPRGPSEGNRFETIEEMAARYVGDLRAVQPNGPYYLGGYCFGGNVAWEIARQLTAQGQRVGLLALFNSGPNHPRLGRVTFTPAWCAKFLANLGRLLAGFLRRPPSEQQRLIAWQARLLGRRLKRMRQKSGQVAHPEDFVDLSACPHDQRQLWETHVRALVAHQTEPWRGRVALFRSASYPLISSFDRAYGWRQFVEGELIVRFVPGTHEQVLQTPHVAALAAELQRCLTSARDRRDTVERHTGPSGELEGACDGERFASLIQRIDRRASECPDAIAVAGEGEPLTYRQLSTRSNLLAAHLRSLGVRPGTLVGLCLDKSWHLVVGLLGILKAGGAYVPMDPSYPRERLAMIWTDAKLSFVLTKRNHLPLFADFEKSSDSTFVLLDSDWERIGRSKESEPGCLPGPESLAYVVFTSGSTGRPKGVLVPRSALENHGRAMAGIYGLEPADRVLQFASLSFDVAAEEVFPTLMTGGTVVLRSPDCTASMTRFIEFVERHRITVLNLPATWWHEMVNTLDRTNTGLPPCVRLVITGNEPVSPEILERWRKITANRVRWLNAYGPTEATITATTYEPDFSVPAPRTRSVPIGRPIANVQTHILDENLKPVRPGTAGELCLGGAGVAHGYLDDPELTAAKFIPDPFAGRPGACLYKTGDLVRVLPDGNLEFLGRLDAQIKIRGLRIEPGEIEAALQRHEGVDQSAVVVRQNRSGDLRLIAHIVARTNPPPSAEELRRFLLDTLPEPLVPASFILLDKLPWTPNGKVDRQALAAPLPHAVELTEDLMAPRTDLERQLVALWEEVLAVRPIDIRSRFFDLGGDSLIAARLMDRIQELRGERLPIGLLLQAPTVQAMAKLLEEGVTGRSGRSSIVEIQPMGSKPPLFLVHGVGGGMFWGYANLARYLGTDQPLYAFKSRALDSLDEFSTLEEMAAQYVADLVSVQSRGPYYLGGYCFGGNVAYEMARQLEARGHHVALLALFNCWPSNCSYDRIRVTPLFCFKFLKNILFWTAYTLRLPPDKRRAVLQWKARSGQRKCLRFLRALAGASDQSGQTDGLDLSGQPEDRRLLWRAHMRSVQEHVPKPYDGHITVFRSRGHPFLCSFDDAYGWKDLARGGVSVHIVPGAHENILDEPYVRALSGVVGECLANVQQSGADSR